MGMTLYEVCEMIALPEEMKKKVLACAKNFDRTITEPFSTALYQPETWKQGVEDITKVLGDDPDGCKMLTCMLVYAADAYEEYQKRGISEKIFADTMKFCTRFTQEHYQVYGFYAFTWGWWFPRQISLHEFRIGALEYEMLAKEGKKLINIHIPADADMTRERLRTSYTNAREFFKKFFPAYSQADMVCDSWLLAPSLQELLPEGSNIISFQNAFDVIRVNEASNGCIRWVYGRTDLLLPELPETTSLQRKIKACLVEGRSIGEAYGKLQQDPWNAYRNNEKETL